MNIPKLAISAALIAGLPFMALAKEPHVNAYIHANTNASFLRVHEHGEEEAEKNQSQAFSGTVTAASSTGFTLAIKKNKTQTVSVSSSTVFAMNGATTTLSSVTPGVKATAVGTWDQNHNIFTAAKVTIRVPHVTFYGRIQSISGSMLTVAVKTKTFTVNATGATFRAKHNAAASLSDLKVNDKVIVKGTLSSASSTLVTATAVHDLSLTK